jgi:serine/threonine protein kinase
MLPPLGCVGKASYMPPEIYLNAEFDESADVWCVGVMLFMMLFGVPPYRKPHADLCALFREIQAGRLLDLLVRWGMAATVSEDAQDLVRRLLITKPEGRPTIPEILAHPWMAPAVAPLGGSAKAPQQANFILEVGRRVHKVLHDQRGGASSASGAATGAAAAASFSASSSTASAGSSSSVVAAAASSSQTGSSSSSAAAGMHR